MSARGLTANQWRNVFTAWGKLEDEMRSRSTSSSVYAHKYIRIKDDKVLMQQREGQVSEFFIKDLYGAGSSRIEAWVTDAVLDSCKLKGLSTLDLNYSTGFGRWTFDIKTRKASVTAIDESLTVTSVCALLRYYEMATKQDYYYGAYIGAAELDSLLARINAL